MTYKKTSIDHLMMPDFRQAVNEDLDHLPVEIVPEKACQVVGGLRSYMVEINGMSDGMHD